MPAPDFPTLYQFEENFEAALVSILTAAGLTNDPTQRGQTSLTTPRTESQFSVGSHYGEHYSHDQSGNYRPDQWNAVARFRIVTVRSQNDASHAVFRGKLRNLFALWNGQFTVANLPYYNVVRMIESGTSLGLDEENNQDISILSYSVIFGIRSDAWPAP